MKQQIKQLSQIDHVLHRPSMYIGSVALETQEEFHLEDDKFVIGQRNYIPGLMKTFNEWIDNSIDEFVRTKGKSATKISVKMTQDTFECSDNGRGIPNTKMETLNGEEKYQAEVAFTEMLSGSNYENDDEATIGTNGLGAKAGSIFAKKSVIVNDDGKKSLQITTKNNLKDVSIKESASKSSGIHAKIWPDLEYFGIDSLDETIHSVIKERLLHLSMSYPGITFRFNSKTIKLNAKNYFGMFNIKEIIQMGDYTIGVSHAESEQFEHFSLVNGLLTKKGGSHIKFIGDDIVNPIREKLVKKFKTIRPADIRNKLRLVVVMNNFMNARYTSQTKEELTNSEKEIRDYLNQKDGYKDAIKKWTTKILKNEDIMLPITELFLLKEQAKENAKLKKLKGKKRIKSEKYLPATKRKRVLMLCEGASAVGGLMPSLGREDYGYFELRGVPLNAYEATQSKFTNNPELSELYQIIQSEQYEYIATATDADSDGQHIKGLLFGFFLKYLPEYIEGNRFGEFNTPVQCVLKNKKMLRWIYNIGDPLNLKAGEVGKYFKGLGSWKAKDLEHVVKTDGITNMIEMFSMDDQDKIIVDDWLNGSKADRRKEYLRDNVFDITAV
jgi:DNA gyrase/topoisomerase IV subunit B